jgi:hypothetical protein
MKALQYQLIGQKPSGAILLTNILRRVVPCSVANCALNPQLFGVINNVLDFGKIENQRMVLEKRELDMRQLLSAAYEVAKCKVWWWFAHTRIYMHESNRLERGVIRPEESTPHPPTQASSLSGCGVVCIGKLRVW